MMQYLILFFVFLTACAAQSPVPADHSEWEPMGYTDFSKNIQTTAGPGSLNCGFIDWTQDPRREVLEESRQCLSYSVENAVPFKFGTGRIPEDSLLYRVLVLSPDRYYWEITLDRMLDDSDIVLRLSKCQHVAVDYEVLTFEGQSCSQIDNTQWPEE